VYNFLSLYPILDKFFLPLQKQNKRKELLLQQERSYPRLYWSVRTALRPLITGCGQITDFDLACGGNSSGNIVSPNSSTSSSISSTCSSNNGNTNTNNQQKRYRRTKTNLLASVPLSQQTDENDETDEEPIL